MVERTEATEWEDRLLRANVLTVSKCPISSKFYMKENNIKKIECVINKAFLINSYMMSSKEDLLYFTGCMGSELKKKKFCFDMFIRVLYDNARRAGFNENGLKRQLEETLLKGFEASIK